ncbi:hypothetical protein L195_g016044 [Trifolium pratense]|uniref:Uncharacterized protein n=1 Tax=Trifolium pratense TaxID=57577 RepID=A0A2K3MQ12_TRIPR|nr:hypothetical protein L195_g016044 [Trifolium pratense]
MVINAIKGPGPALEAIYTRLLAISQGTQPPSTSTGTYTSKRRHGRPL